MGGGMGGGGGVNMDPLMGLNDTSKPLRSKLLAVPALKQRYLSYVRTIAEDWLDWNTLGPVVDSYAKLIGPYVEADTRKFTSYEAFLTAVNARDAADGKAPEATPPGSAPGGPGPGRGPRLSIRQFAEQRKSYLLNLPAIKEVQRTDFVRPALPPKEEKADKEKASK